MLDSANAASNIGTEGPMLKAVWHLTFPLFVNFFSVAASIAVYAWISGRLGSDAQAALGFCGNIWTFFWVPTLALSVGATAMLSRLAGASHGTKFLSIARLALNISLFLGIVQMLFELLLGTTIMRLLGASQGVTAMGWDYIKIDSIDHIPASILLICSTIFLARGNAHTPTRVTAIKSAFTVLAQLALCIWPWQFGIAGLAAAWPIGNSIAALVMVVALFADGTFSWAKAKIKRKTFVPLSRIYKLFQIGIPSSMQALIWAVASCTLLVILSKTQNATAAQAAWHIGLRIEEVLADPPAYALSTAAANLVGQNLGAVDQKRAERAGWWCAGIGFIINTLVGCFMFFGADSLAHLISHDADVIAEVTTYLKILAASEPFIGLWFVLFGAMDGAGYTKWPMWIRFVSLFAIRIPLAWYLAIDQNMGATGVWISLAVSTTIIGILAAIKFKGGKWKRHL